MKSDLSFKDLFVLRFQIALDHLLMFFVGHFVILFIKHIWKYKIENQKEIRAQFRAILKNKKPTLICSNHLTMIDSVIIHYAVNSVMGYVLNFRSFSWNIPAIENLKGAPLFRIFTYLGGSIPIDRTAPASHHENVLNKLKYLMERGHVCTIFPEGTRSRTGQIDPEKVTYGVGNILRKLSDYQVVCIYQRAEHQKYHTTLPPKQNSIYFKMEVIEPGSEQKGMRGVRDLSRQIIDRLKEMELEYFKLHPDRIPPQPSAEEAMEED